MTRISGLTIGLTNSILVWKEANLEIYRQDGTSLIKTELILIIESPKKDAREHVPMFEHKLVVEQLKNTIQEKNKIMGQYLKLQTDINR